jgi:signal transduction histidine kinase
LAIVIDNESAIEIYRIAQEAVNNAVKHAHAKSIVIAIENCGSDILLRVSDDGVGLSTGDHHGHGMGMNIMRYRARRIGAALEFSGNSPSGVVVNCSLKRAPRVGTTTIDDTSSTGKNGRSRRTLVVTKSTGTERTTSEK